MSLPTHACTRCGLPTHHRGSRCTDCYLPYAQETAMPAHRSRTLTRPGGTDEHVKGDDWRADAACRDADPELFFAPPYTEGTRLRRERVADALSYCDRCDVVAECRENTLAHGDEIGIWGGLSEEDLADVRRTQRGQRRRSA